MGDPRDDGLYICQKENESREFEQKKERNKQRNVIDETIVLLNILFSVI